MECGVIYKLVEPFQSFVFGSVKEYVGYIGNCRKNLGALHKSLDDLCNKKGDIKMKVKVGTDKLEKVTRVAAHWLDDVQMLATDKVFKELMYKDIETAKFVVKLMEKKDLKRCLIEEKEMQELVVKVMKKLKEELETREEDDEMRRIIEEDYKNVGEVVVEVMKDTLDEFKNLIKQDKQMAVIATTTLLKKDLDKLTTDDQEMEDIFMKVTNASDEELGPNLDDEESNAPLLKNPAVGVSENNTLTDYAMKLFTPLSYLLTPLGKLMNDAKFKKAVPMAEGIKLGLDVIDVILNKSPGFKKDMIGDNAERRHRSCCCCSSLSLCDYHGHYQISKAAEAMAKCIEDKISKCPTDSVTSPISSANLKPIPTKFLKGLASRTNLFNQILEKLEDDKVSIVGVLGMGGTGKTVLAKEVRNADTRIFSIKVMVEVSDTPDIMRIQGAIAESIGLPLREVDNIDLRAKRIYNRLVSEKKALIILDNIWKRVDLTEIGIPETCKLLLTTREREVCREMRLSEENVFKVDLMKTNEARELFKREAGDQVDDGKFKEVVDRLLSKCGGLPLAIVATANALKDKPLPRWNKFAKDVEKPISIKNVPGDYRDMYSILNASYKFIESKEKKKFFLLACLSPRGSSASVENLMRYGIGLNLFQCLDDLCEAMEEANTWTGELLSSSMLLEGDAEGCVKIHDIVRDFGIFLAAKEESHKFMVDDIPRWLDDETLNTYTGMSLMSANDYSRLSGMKAYMLRILILKGGQSQYIDDLFFKGMVNLEVLVMSHMNFELELPESISELKKLRTLCMERCKLGDMQRVGKLTNLLVLSLRGSFVKKLPNDIGELSKLRLLDLNDCTFTKVPPIPASVLRRLENLEGLYLLNTKGLGSIVEKKIDDDDSGKSENEDIKLSRLKAFEIKVSEIKQMPVDGRSLQNVDKFIVRIGKDINLDINLSLTNVLKDYWRALHVCRALYMCDYVIVTEELEKNGLGVLLNKADLLSIISPEYCENLVPQLNREGFRDLKCLLIEESTLTCIVKVGAMTNLKVFPSLESLYLYKMAELKVICDGEAPLEMFSNVKYLTLCWLKVLLYGLPLVPHNLEAIDVSGCDDLKVIFLKDEEAQIMELPFLKTLKLYNMARLSSLVGPREYFEPFERRNLFDEKITCPSLELLQVDSCTSLVRLWGNGVYHFGFQMLKDVHIQYCEGLLSIGPPSLFSGLMQLETLSINSCSAMREVVCREETTESEIHEQLITFPRLKRLELWDLDNVRTLCTVGYILEFPELKELKLDSLSRLNKFSQSENSETLFGKIDFPCLEVLEMTSMSDEVTRLWDWQVLSTEKGSSVSNPVPMLRWLKLGRGSAGLHDIPSVILEKLSSLTLHHLSDAEGYDEEWFVRSYSQLLNLEELKVVLCRSFNELFENWEGAAAKRFCERLKTLELKCVTSLRLIPLHLFTALASLTLYQLNWEYAISGDMLANSLQQLEVLEISYCFNMETVVEGVVSLPRLKKLMLEHNKIKRFSSSPKEEVTLSLPSLEVLKIYYEYNMKYFGSIVAPKLREVSLSYCPILEQLLIANPELPYLQLVSIKDCEAIPSIFFKPFKAPKLRKVKVVWCRSLRCLVRYPDPNGVVELPFLEAVEISESPKFHSFLAASSVARNLNHVRYNREEYSMVPYDYDLNRFLKSQIDTS